MGGSRGPVQGWPRREKTTEGACQGRPSEIQHGEPEPPSYIAPIGLIQRQPVDSEHPDRSASVTAIVERWYTEEQYIAAKEAHELAWQDSDKPFAEPETPSDRSV